MGLFDSFQGKTLYFPGCAPKFLVKEVQNRHKELLKKFGIEFVTLPKEEVCCGKPALDYGYPEDFRNLRDKNSDLFRNNKITKIVAGSPECYYIFKKKYDDTEIEVEHISQTILDNIDKIEKRFDGQQVTFHDHTNPYKLKELYDNPREILKALGLRIVELPLNKEKSLACGKAMQNIAPKVGEAMAKELLENVKTKTVITTSTDCLIHLKDAKTSIKIRELTEVLV